MSAPLAELQSRLPGGAFLATNSDGSFIFSRSFGKTGHGESVEPDKVMWIASCSKLISSVAALQLVEAGKISLDESVLAIIPELGKLQLFKGFDDKGNGILEDTCNEKITLRKMLSHQAGLRYEIFEEDLIKLAESKPAKTPEQSAEIVTDLDAPLVYPPGDGWAYGTGVEYAGLLVERLSGMTLEAYLKKNIFEPLGMNSTSFEPNNYPHIKEKRIGMSIRDPDTGVPGPTPGGLLSSMKAADGDKDQAYGGAGLFGPASDYIKFLEAILSRGGKILKPETVNEMFKPQLGPGGKEMFNAACENDPSNSCTMNFSDKDLDWGLGGTLGSKNEEGRRSAGSMAWSGLPNLHWWVDRSGGLAGCYFSQLLPDSDITTKKAFMLLEAEAYKEFKAWKAKQ